MKEFWIGFAVCYAISFAFFCLDVKFDRDCLVEWYTAPWVYAVLVVLYLPLTLYKMFRLVFRGVRPEQIREAREQGMPPDKHLFGNLYCCRDKKAQYPCNRFFFFRIKREKTDGRR